MRKLALSLGLLLVGSGCGDAEKASTVADDTGVDSVGPCAGGAWGSLASPGDALHVRVDGSDAVGDGSLEAPLATLEAALAASRLSGAPRTIFVGPGDYNAEIELRSDGGADDQGLELLGCGADEVTLLAADASAPVVKISGTLEVAVRDVTLSGGRRTLWIWQGATATITDLRVVGGTRANVVMDGSETVFDNVEILDPIVEEEDFGYGILVQNGAAATITGGMVSGASGAGVLVDAAELVATDLAVEDTSESPSGLFGRGIQLQELSSATLTGLQLSRNSDAGIFALRPNMLEITSVSISATVASGIPDSAEESGDGIVVSEGSMDYGPGSFLASLTDNVIEGSARAGILIDGGGVEISALSGNVTSDNGFLREGTSIVAQDGPVLPTGADASWDPVAAGEAALDLNSSAFAADTLTE